MARYKAHLIVRNVVTREEVHRVGVTNLSDRHVEKAMLGMLRNMNTDKYFIDDSDVDRARAMLAKGDG